MSRNRRKNSDTIRVATCVWWILAFSIIGGLGLSYVSIKNQSIAYGDDRRKLEAQLNETSKLNRALENQINGLVSWNSLQRQLQSGFIQLVEIDPTQIVRINTNPTEIGYVSNANTPERILAQK